MIIGVKFKLNVSKILKEHMFKGEKGVYLDCTSFIDLDNTDQYGNNCMVTQEIPKEKRDAGEKGPILGNGKIFYRKDDNGQQNNYQGQNNQGNNGGQGQIPDDDTTIPF